ncbi:cuticle collagen 34-like, partial [Leptonychotes weddellii]|uniref:Cuticle collagen 34-like n=1 Tax=Leptonychotes weddellii TaxID=9713 RepID=A0A7F8RR30_LEPWE
ACWPSPPGAAASRVGERHRPARSLCPSRLRGAGARLPERGKAKAKRVVPLPGGQPGAREPGAQPRSREPRAPQGRGCSGRCSGGGPSLLPAPAPAGGAWPGSGAQNGQVLLLHGRDAVPAPAGDQRHAAGGPGLPEGRGPDDPEEPGRAEFYVLSRLVRPLIVLASSTVPGPRPKKDDSIRCQERGERDKHTYPWPGPETLGTQEQPASFGSHRTLELFC